MMKSASLAVLAALALASPALADPGDDEDIRRGGFAVSYPTDHEGRSAYGLYLAGQMAAGQGDIATAADYFAASRSVAPDQPILNGAAFWTALLAGDLDVAATTAPHGERPTSTVTEAGDLITAVQLFAQGNASAANAALIDDPVDAPHRAAGAMVAPWIAAAAKDWDRALATPPAALDPMSRSIIRFHRAEILELARRHDEAEAIYKELTAVAQPPELYSQGYGEFLERRRRRSEALAVYEAGLVAHPGDAGLAEAVARVKARQPAPPAPTPTEGASIALAAAGASAALQKSHQFAVLYYRLALALHDDQAVRWELARALSDGELSEPALQAYGAITMQHPELYASARQQMAWAYNEAGDNEAAIAEARRAQAALPQDPTATLTLANLLVGDDRYDEALALLNGPVLNAVYDQPWQVRFARGAAYESTGRVPEAEAELWAALQLQPDHPSILNYLGYLWVDRVGRLEEGREMIARAVAAEPGNANFQDSLGWAQYRQGEYDLAVETLEEAVTKQPSNATLNDHLGDAYWAVGRQREAGFLWNRVLTLDPSAELRAEAERKIAEGLPAPALAE